MKKVSVNKWKKLLPKTEAIEHTDVIHFPDNDQVLEIIVKPDLSVADRMSLSKDIVDACFDVNNGSYIPYAFDVSFGIYMITYFTNLDIGSDTETAMSLIKHSDIIDVIKKHIDIKTWEHIETEIYELLQWEKSRKKQSNKADELFDALTDLVSNFSNVADHAKDKLANDDISELLQVMKQFGNQEDFARAVLKAQKERK